MNSKIRIALFLSAAALGLSQQVSAAMPAESGQATVTVPLTGSLDNVELSRIDGKTAENPNTANLTPGAHTLTVTIQQEGRGSADQDCTVNFPYSAFKANHQYIVDEHTAGPNVVANLENAMGKTVSYAADMSCMDI